MKTIKLHSFILFTLDYYPQVPNYHECLRLAGVRLQDYTVYLCTLHAICCHGYGHQ